MKNWVLALFWIAQAIVLWFNTGGWALSRHLSMGWFAFCCWAAYVNVGEALKR